MTGTRCRHCDAPLPDGARFCPQCGRPLPEQRISQMEAVVSGEVDATLVAELQQEKQRLHTRLRQLLDAAEHRALTDAERAEWKRGHKLWERVRDALTRQMQHLAARDTHERRASERRIGERRKQPIAIDVPDQRSGRERRTQERRGGDDRRDPFTPPE